ncbi:hypothetical protein OPT61_g4788 [Boeremia exigua]|uniref:Uncharacterized protein n=1 Tax=Boeremia exigua TaxID=749465 RepID=A0ACC2ICT4_9PLEO|nr:hypothetical protein OPT61_g4788 [Boeremia exigua]
MATNEGAEKQRFETLVRQGVVTVEVGPDRIKYFVHRTLLEQHSEYFKKALNGPWKEAEDRTVRLEDVDCGAFGVFVDWLYTRKLPAKLHEWVAEEYQHDQHVRWHAGVQVAMVKSCAFANRMLSPVLQHAIELEIIDHFVVHNNKPYYEAVILAFNSLPPERPVLRVREIQLEKVDDHATEDEKKGCQNTGPKSAWERRKEAESDTMVVIAPPPIDESHSLSPSVFPPPHYAVMATSNPAPDEVEKPFRMDCARRHSYNTALGGPWKEAEEGIVRLNDIEPETFSFFVDWIYTKQHPAFEDSWGDLSGEQQLASQILRLKACIFGDRFLASEFVQATRKRLIFRLINVEGLSYETIIFAFNNFTADDLLLQLMVDVHCNEGNTISCTADEAILQESLPRSFLLRAMNKYAERFEHETVEACDYHNHSSREERKEHAARAGDYANIVLTTDGSEYHILKPLLTEQSHCFAAAFDGANDDFATIYQLENVESGTFDVFVTWLRQRILPELLGHWDRPKEHQETEITILKAYVFAEQYDILGFKQALLDNFIRSFLDSDINGASMSGVPFFKTITYAFENLPSEDILLKLFVDVYCYYFDALMDSQEEVDDRNHLPRAFLIRTMSLDATVYSPRSKFPALSKTTFQPKSNGALSLIHSIIASTMAAERPRLSTAFREGSVAMIILKPHDIKYTVHRAVLIEQSDYFKKALIGSWMEAHESTVRLEDVEQKTLDVFVEWIYTQTLPKSHQGWHETRTPEEVEHAMLQAYVFGDRYQALSFKAAVFQDIIKYFSNRGFSTPSYKMIIYAFNNLPEEDTVLTLLVELQCARYSGGDSGEEKQYLAKLPHQFLVRVMKQYSAKGVRKWGIDESKYSLK